MQSFSGVTYIVFVAFMMLLHVFSFHHVRNGKCKILSFPIQHFSFPGSWNHWRWYIMICLLNSWLFHSIQMFCAFLDSPWNTFSIHSNIKLERSSEPGNCCWKYSTWKQTVQLWKWDMLFLFFQEKGHYQNLCLWWLCSFRNCNTFCACRICKEHRISNSQIGSC